MNILGIDPGCRFAGYCLWQRRSIRAVQLITAGCLKLDAKKPLSVRICRLYDFFSELVLLHKVSIIALETPFLGKNANNFLKLGYVRGILYLIAAQNNLDLQEFSPCEVKRAVTGSGNASKEQVARALSQIVPQMKNLNIGAVRDDVTDAIAIGLTAMWRHNDVKAH